MAGFLALAAGVVGYYFGVFWAAFPAVLSLIKWVEYLERKRKVNEGVKRIILGEGAKVRF